MKNWNSRNDGKRYKIEWYPLKPGQKEQLRCFVQGFFLCVCVFLVGISAANIGPVLFYTVLDFFGISWTGPVLFWTPGLFRNVLDCPPPQVVHVSGWGAAKGFYSKKFYSASQYLFFYVLFWAFYFKLNANSSNALYNKLYYTKINLSSLLLPPFYKARSASW